MFWGVLRIGRRMLSTKMDKLIEELSASVSKGGLTGHKQEQQAMRNYIQLTQQSYTEHITHQLKNKEGPQHVIDPKLILMILPTLQQQHSIKEHLNMLYPYLQYLTTSELTLFYQYLLAHRPSVLPKLPTPKSLNSNESLLVLLGQLYQKNLLVDWLKQVPLYQGTNAYMLAMGTFSILSGIDRSQHSNTVSRCLDRIRELFNGADNQARIGVILLALQAGLPISEQLLLTPYSLDLEELDGLKLSLLLIQLDRYIKVHFGGVRAQNPNKKDALEAQLQEVDIEGVDRLQRSYQQEKPYIYDSSKPHHVKYKLQSIMLSIIKALKKQEWKLVIKLHIMVRLFGVLRARKLQKDWEIFAYKIFNFAARKDQLVLLSSLSSDELIGMLEVLQMHKINKPTLVKHILVRITLSQRLETAEATELVRLSKCLVTYVRLCEDYLLHFRVILERRKFIFTMDQLQQLDDNFRRVQSLFPKSLSR